MAYVRSFKNLIHLNISGTQVSNGGLSNLKGCENLRILYLGQTHISDLAALKDMKLTTLDCSETQVGDLSPLKGMKLTYLGCVGMQVKDLSPLKEMPLKELACDIKLERGAEIVRSIKTLTTINGKPAAEFWKDLDANQAKNSPAPKPPASTSPVDPFRAKSVWINDEQKMNLTVLERKGETFRARFVIGPTIDREVTGTVKDGKLSWLAKDVKAVNGNGGGDNQATITRDNDGDLLEFTWSVQGSGSGVFVLRLKTGK
jgi:hypothetical protein